MLLVYADGPDGPLPDPALIPGGPHHVILGFTVRRPDWLDRSADPVTTLLCSPGSRSDVATGRVRSVPTRLSAVPGLFAGRFRPDLAVLGAHEGPGGRWRLACDPGYALAAARAARLGAVVERWPGPPPARAPELPPVAIFSVVDRDCGPDPVPTPGPGGALRDIATLISSLLPVDATVQWGPGAVGAAFVDAIGTTVAVRSGLVTNELSGLYRRGRLHGTAVAAYTWGADLAAMVGEGRLRLEEVGYTHDVAAMAAIDRFVAVNAALQVGLDGSVNVEVVGGRTVSGPGGHPDFAAGASRSPGGISIVALPSTSSGRSTIVSRPETTSTPGRDVDVVVTEHGVADLRGQDSTGRARRIAAVADPEWRDRLLRDL